MTVAAMMLANGRSSLGCRKTLVGGGEGKKNYKCLPELDLCDAGDEPRYRQKLWRFTYPHTGPRECCRDFRGGIPFWQQTIRSGLSRDPGPEAARQGPPTLQCDWLVSVPCVWSKSTSVFGLDQAAFKWHSRRLGLLKMHSICWRIRAQ